MCYNASIPDRTELDDLLDLAIRTDDWTTYFHHLSGFTFAKVPVLTQEKPDQIQAINWGLIPSWCKDAEHAKEMRMYTLNAKAETIFEKPSYKNNITKHRCLIFVNGFFEWREFNRKKYPYFIYLKNQKAFALGGIYDSWVNKETGEIHATCSIITTQANPLMAKIHNSKMRMPLIFTKEKMMEWIKPELKPEEIESIIKPLDENLMEAYTISKLITSRKENPNVPEVKNELQYPELKVEI